MSVSRDTPPHVPQEELSWDYVYDVLLNHTTLLMDAFPDVPVFPSLGNHDAYPNNEVPLAPSKYYGNIMKRCKWDQMITGDEAQRQFYEGLKCYLLQKNNIKWCIFEQFNSL